MVSCNKPYGDRVSDIPCILCAMTIMNPKEVEQGVAGYSPQVASPQNADVEHRDIQ